MVTFFGHLCAVNENWKGKNEEHDNQSPGNKNDIRLWGVFDIATEKAQDRDHCRIIISGRKNWLSFLIEGYSCGEENYVFLSFSKNVETHYAITTYYIVLTSSIDIHFPKFSVPLEWDRGLKIFTEKSFLIFLYY